jgi:hypothetical protein
MPAEIYEAKVGRYHIVDFDCVPDLLIKKIQVKLFHRHPSKYLTLVTKVMHYCDQQNLKFQCH